jgi:PAS domain S-box-containing protein
LLDASIVPLAAILVSTVFAAVSIAWDSDNRATGGMATLFLYTGCWALVDLLTSIETDPQRALLWMRWAHLPPLMIGPGALWVVAQMNPEARVRLERHARIAALGCFGLGIAVAFMPGATQAMLPNAWGGWMPRYGAPSFLVIPLGLVVPLYAAHQAARSPERESLPRVDRVRAWGTRVSIGLSVLLAVPTEYILPLLGIPFPRLGPLGISCACAVVWLTVLHDTEDLMLTPQSVARTLLAKLQDGVVLVRLDGLILSTNARFSEVSGRNERELVDMSLSDLIDAPIEQVCGGVDDRESVLHAQGGKLIPVSLSSSIAHSRTGNAIGVVVVFRDLREVDALRSQILTSGRLAAVGQLAAGIAHEVNNPVAFVRSDLNMLAERIDEIRGRVEQAPGRREDSHLFANARLRVENALEGVARIAEVVVDVREFAHVGGARQGGSHPEDVVEGAMRLARLQRGEDVELTVQPSADVERIEVGQELKQILLAILRLLAEAAQKGSRIDADIHTRDEALVIGISAGPLIVSSSVIRERFESLGSSVLDAEAGELGLTIAGELIAQLGGRLQVDSRGDAGLRVEVSVPQDARGAAS